MKRILFLCLVMSSLMCHAARQEDDINKMIYALHKELNLRWNEIKKDNKANKALLLKLDTLILDCNDASKECAMTVYSIDANSFQDVAYANQNATEQYEQFGEETASYTSMLADYQQRVLRQDSLRNLLTSVGRRDLDHKAIVRLSEAFSILAKIQAHDKKVLQHLKSLKPEYDEAYKRLEQTTKICKKKYQVLRSNVFYNFKDNIFNIIVNWDAYIQRIDRFNRVTDESGPINVKLSSEEGSSSISVTDNVSDWGNGNFILNLIALAVFFVIAIFAALLVCLVRWIIKRILMLHFWSRTRLGSVTDGLLRGIRYINGFKTFVLLTFWLNALIFDILAIYSVFFFSDGHEGLQKVNQSGDEQVWCINILAIIVTFLILKYSGKRFWCSLGVCMPTLLAVIYTIYSVIRIVTDDEVAITMTAFSVFFFTLQVLFSWLCRKHLDKQMQRISYMGLVFFGFSMALSLIGLQFFASMLIVFWCIFMTFTIILTSLKLYLDKKITSHNLNEKRIKYTWGIPLFNRVLYPMAWLYSIKESCELACMQYNLNEFLDHLLNTSFVTAIGNISFNVNLLFFICWNILLAAYISKALYQFIDDYHKARGEKEWKDTSFFNQNIIRTLVWGIAVVNIMMRMGFSMEWIGYCMAGLGTGIGFASRDILENLIYGITLRNGQLKIGDWIICGNVRGQIKSIGLLSTRLDSVEGTVVSYGNSQLFRKDFENITLNHGYELLHTQFSVKYGEDIDRLREILVDGYTQYDCYDKERPVTLYCKKISDSSIILDFRVWIPARDRIRLAAFNQEYVYKTLMTNNIKCAYPVIEIIDK